MDIKELKWCRQNNVIARDKAINIFHLCINDDKFGEKKDVLTKKLEKVYRKYNEKMTINTVNTLNVILYQKKCGGVYL